MAGAARVVLVTGGARRIGAAIVRELHAAGWRVAIHARRSRDEALALAAELEAARSGSAQVFGGDLAQAEAIEHLARASHAHWGRLDALVNNASSYYATPLGEIRASALDDLLATNLKAPLLLTQACVARMDSGAIVNLIDVHARKPQARYSAYCAAKAGLWALTESLALELAPRIRVNAVAPGFMLWAEQEPLDEAARARLLARVPLQRLGGALEIARAVRFLLSEDAQFMTGAVLPVDGGLHLR
jgi:pteridine reductase